ncbi:MAG: glycosyltransferase family 87 protein, partial [Chloroflexota bacterium]
LLRPFAGLSEHQAYRLWAALLIACGALGSYLALYEWPRRPRLLASALVACSPAALFDLRLGQNSTPLLLALGAAYRLTSLGRPFLAGLCLGCGLFKPHLMGPIAVIVILAAPRGSKRAMTAGFALAGGLAVLVGVLFDGGPAVYGHWLTGLRQLGDSISLQPDLASVSGLYQGSAASGVLNAACLLGAAGIIALLALRAQRSGLRGRQDLLGGGIAVYLALSPYVHTSDQILLAPALLALIGPSGDGLREQAVLLAAWVVILAPMVVIRDYHTVGINALPPITVALAYWMRCRCDARILGGAHG